MVPGRKPAALGIRLYWRKDGVAIWKNSDLIATIEIRATAAIKDAARFAEGTAEKLGPLRTTSCRRSRTRHWIHKGSLASRQC